MESSEGWIPKTSSVPLEMEVDDDHPPYAEMIYRAIEALREKDGSTKNAIDKYILQNYGDRLRHTHHPTLLTRHLHHLTSAALLVLINNNSYKLPSALPYPPPTTTTTARSPTPTIVVVGPTEPVTTDLPPGGSPPNPNRLKRRRPGRPPKTQNATASPPTHTVAVVGKPKNPVGRPKGSKSAANRGGQIKVGDVGDLVRRLEYFQSKVKESLDVLKPYFNHESPVTAISAIKELEALANLDLKTQMQQQQQQHEQQFPQIPLYPSASTSST